VGRNVARDDRRRIRMQRERVHGLERRRRADDVAAEADGLGALERAAVRADDVGEIDAPIQQFVDLEVRVGVGEPDRVAVVGFREEARGAQDHDREAVVAVHELAEVLGGGLGRAVDVARDGPDVLGDPGRGRARRRRQRAAERAGRAREDEPADARRHGLLEQRQHAREVGVDEVLACVRGHVRLVQRRGVQHGVGARDQAPDERAVGDRPDRRGVGRRQHVDRHDARARVTQDAAERLPEVAGAARDAMRTAYSTITSTRPGHGASRPAIGLASSSDGFS
jgi:hypothetical protein